MNLHPHCQVWRSSLFPSPCGEKVGINCGLCPSLCGNPEAFPSPCGEKVGINHQWDHNVWVVAETFPSPCGEKVGINRVVITPKGEGVTVQFPSPCGEKVGINRPDRKDLLAPGELVVSVPLRGKGRDQPLLRVILITGSITTFPSPCGEKVGINQSSDLLGLCTSSNVSVPLRGKGRDQPYPRKRLNP